MYVSLWSLMYKLRFHEVQKYCTVHNGCCQYCNFVRKLTVALYSVPLYGAPVWKVREETDIETKSTQYDLAMSQSLFSLPC